MVAQLRDIKLVTSDAGSKGRDQRANLLARQHPVKPCAFHVQDLAAQWKYRLIAAGSSLLGRPTCTVTLDKEQLGQGRVLFLAIGKLARQGGNVHCGLASCQFSRFARSLAGQSGLDDLADDLFGDLGVLFKPLRQFFVHKTLNGWSHL